MISRFRKGVILAMLLSGCAAAGEGASAKPAVPSVGKPQTLAAEQLTIQTATGPRIFRMQVAADEATREYGLMFRAAMRDDQGMIFDFHTPQRVAFWMKNTLIPLDMLFVGSDGRIVNIGVMAKPHDETPVPSAAPIRAVIEINGGLAEKLGIRPGDRVRDARVFGNG